MLTVEYLRQLRKVLPKRLEAQDTPQSAFAKEPLEERVLPLLAGRELALRSWYRDS